ncbi:unnamed protein product [Closterium sp. NIES-65]|nr:unnamed protein product [Closterium sp. NIES-65]
MERANHSTPRGVDQHHIHTNRVIIRERLREWKNRVKCRAQGLYASGYHNGYGSAPYGSLQASVAAGGGRKAAMATAAAAATSSLAAVRVFKGNSVLAQFKARFTARFAEGPVGLLTDTADAQRAAGEALTATRIEATGELGERGEAEGVGGGSGADGARQAVVVGGLGAGEEQQSAAVRMAQAVLLPALGAVSHAFMHGLNRTEVIGAHKLTNAIAHRPPGTPLLTVANHVAAMDDPLVMAAVVPPSLMLARPASLRWTLCASDRCFSSPLLSAFFTSLRALPVERGGGIQQPVSGSWDWTGGTCCVDLPPAFFLLHSSARHAPPSPLPLQPPRNSLSLTSRPTPPEAVGPLSLSSHTFILLQGMVAAAQQLSNGGWVHIFPEGTRSLDGGRTVGPMRRGVAWLAAQCTVPPLIIPVVHVGMHRVQARGQTLPAVGQRVAVMVGDPIDISDLLHSYRAELQRLHSTLLAHEQHSLEGRVADSEIAAPMGGAGAGVMVGGVDNAGGARDLRSDVYAASDQTVSESRVEGAGLELSEPHHPHWQLHLTDSRVSHWPFPLAAHPLGCLESHRWHSLTLASPLADASPPGGSSSSRVGATGLLHSQWAAAAAAAGEAVVRQQEAERVALLFGFAARCAMGGGQWRQEEALVM